MSDDADKSKTPVRPLGTSVGKRLRLLELSSLTSTFGIPLEDCKDFLHSIGVPTLSLGDRSWYEESTFERVLTELSKPGGLGLGMEGTVGVEIIENPGSDLITLKPKPNWKPGHKPKGALTIGS